MQVPHIGVTGSRLVPVGAQLGSLEILLMLQSRVGPFCLHHGCCTGWDAAAHRIAFSLDAPITIHPPAGERHKATNLADGPNVTILGPKGYHERNDDIATVSDMLIAGPRYPEDDPRSRYSGTWQTVRLARWHNVPSIIIVAPDGSVRDGKNAPAPQVA